MESKGEIKGESKGENVSKKIYYTMGELVEMFDVNASLIRHWEGQFDIIKPVRNKKGNRLFTTADVENFKLIYHLVKERGMTLDGAKKALKRGSMVSGSSLERDAKIMERLQNLRALLVEMKGSMDDEEEEFYAEEAESDVAQVCDATQASDDENMMVMAPRRGDVSSEPDAEARELFAFYEQRLF